MKLQVSITRSGVLTNQAPFSSMEEAQAWVDSHVGIGSFGPSRYAMQQVEIAPAVIGEEELLDSEGASFDPPQFQDVEISPAQFEEQSVEVNPEGYVISIEDVTVQESAAVSLSSKIEMGRAAREACQQVLDLVAGHNLDRELSMEDITLLQSMMAGPETALRAGRPSKAKQLIQAITPDETLVTQSMKDQALALLANY